MLKDKLLTYIKHADIFDIALIELHAEVRPGSLSDTIEGRAELSDQSAIKIARLFKKLGVNPLAAESR